MDKPLILKGKAHIISERDVDTDMIFHNRYLHITDSAEMAKYMFDNLPGHEDFPQKAQPGDILITGHNFGCGSSRQQAVDGFIALGVAAIVGTSFGAIYKRNTINAGLPLVDCPSVLDSGINDGDVIEINLETGEIRNNAGKIIAQGKPLGEVQKDIYFAEGLLALAGRE